MLLAEELTCTVKELAGSVTGVRIAIAINVNCVIRVHGVQLLMLSVQLLVLSLFPK